MFTANDLRDNRYIYIASFLLNTNPSVRKLFSSLQLSTYQTIAGSISGNPLNDQREEYWLYYAVLFDNLNLIEKVYPTYYEYLETLAEFASAIGIADILRYCYSKNNEMIGNIFLAIDFGNIEVIDELLLRTTELAIER